MRYRAMRANRRPTYGYGKLNGRRGGGGSAETQRLGAPDDEDDEDEDAGEEDEVDRYIASIRQGASFTIASGFA